MCRPTCCKYKKTAAAAAVKPPTSVTKTQPFQGAELYRMTKGFVFPCPKRLNNAKNTY